MRHQLVTQLGGDEELRRHHRFSAAVTCVELLAAYLLESAPRGLWPIRNGGNETLLYFSVFLSLAVYGAGALAVDSLRYRRKAKRPSYAAAG